MAFQPTPADERAAELQLRALLANARFEAAAAAAPALIMAFPRAPELRCHHAAALFRIGRLDDAIAACREVFKLAPAHPVATHIYTDARIFARKAKGLADELEPRARAARPDPRLLLSLARACEAEKLDERALAALDRLDALPGVPPPVAREAAFLRGRVLERRGDYEPAFRAFERANAPTAGTYQRDKRRAVIDQLIARTTREALAAAPSSGATSQLPVYIVGMPRSGTTLVEQIVGAHPRAAALGERPDIFLLARRVNLQSPAPVLAAAADEQLALLRSLAPGADRALDKNPFNFRNLALLAALFPRARVIHCVRDPLDTCLSCWTQQFEFPQDFTASFDDLAAYCADYRRLMAHWRDVLALPMLEVVYEDLVADPETGARRLIDFLALDWNDACLRPHESSRVAMTASHEQVRRPVYTSSVARAKRFGPLVDPLVRALEREGVA